MKKTKATFVICVMTALLIAVMAFLLILKVKVAFFGIFGIFAIIGLIFSDAWILSWLCEKDDDEDEQLEPVNVCEPETDYDIDAEIAAIRRELGGDEL